MRPYKAAWSSQRALEYIESQAGRSFDPGLVSLMLQLAPQLTEIRQLYHDDLPAGRLLQPF